MNEIDDGSVYVVDDEQIVGQPRFFDDLQIAPEVMQPELFG